MHRRSFLIAAAAAFAAILGASAGAQADDPMKVSASFSILGDHLRVGLALPNVATIQALTAPRQDFQSPSRTYGSL